MIRMPEDTSLEERLAILEVTVEAFMLTLLRDVAAREANPATWFRGFMRRAEEAVDRMEMRPGMTARAPELVRLRLERLAAYLLEQRL